MSRMLFQDADTDTSGTVSDLMGVTALRIELVIQSESLRKLTLPD